MMMKAMILAAGTGTRLRPITDKIPKALVEVNGIAMIERVITKMKKSGITEIIINLHHFPELIRGFINDHHHFDLNIEFSDESEELLDTGGGLKKAAPFFHDGKPFLVHNVDVLSDIDFGEMLGFHMARKALVTLFVKDRSSSRYLIFDTNDQLVGWKNTKTGELKTSGIINQKSRNLAFNGIHIIDPEIFSLINRKGCFSIIDIYLQLAKRKKIVAWNPENASFMDIGRPESLMMANRFLKENG